MSIKKEGGRFHNNQALFAEENIAKAGRNDKNMNESKPPNDG